MADNVNQMLRLSRQGRSGGVQLDPNEPEVPASALDAALMFGPVGPAASMAYRGLTAAPKVTGTALGMLGLLSPSATAQDSGTPQPVDLTDLYRRRTAAEQRRAKADAEMEAQKKTGRGPRFDKAADAVKQANDEISALDKAITRAEEMNSPEYRLKMDQARAKADDDARAKRANTPFKELYADAMPYVAPAAALTAGLVGAAIKQPYAARAADEAADISQRWARAVGMTPPQGPRGVATPTPRAKPDPFLAHEYRLAFPNTPAGGDKAAVAAGIGIGELSQLLPLAIDYQRALPGSPLATQVHDQLTDLPGLAGRMVQGALLGGIPAKIGTKAVDSAYARYYPRYDAETNALLSQLAAPRGPPGGGGGPPPLPGPAAPPAIPPANPPQVGPPIAGPPNRPGPSGSLPAYRPDKNGVISRQYIDDLLASGQSLPANAADDLAARMPGINPASIGPRVDATRPLVDALVGADQATQAAVLGATIGKPGSKMLGVGAAGAGAAAMMPEEAQAQPVDEFTAELMAVAQLLEQMRAAEAQAPPPDPAPNPVPAYPLNAMLRR